MHNFNCIATSIGSLPVTDPELAVDLSLAYLTEAPIWPQLPRRDFCEHIGGQYSESLPGLRLEEGKERFFFDTVGDLTPDLERFFERYLAKDYGFFRISEQYASGYYAFLRALKKGVPTGTQFIKGHIIGPLTAGSLFKDEAGRDIIHNNLFYDALVKGLAMKAAWQIEELKQFGKPVIIFIDEPAMESLGSAFCAVSSEVAVESLAEIIDVIHEAGGIAGVHCCGNTDWPLLFNTSLDIVNFDAFGYMEKVLLYPEAIKKFMDRGGALAWGIVPTTAFTGKETADQLLAKLNAGINTLESYGIAREVILHQSLITPACGLGSLMPDAAEAILKLLRQITDRMRQAVVAN